jgi:hypothetical protein
MLSHNVDDLSYISHSIKNISRGSTIRGVLHDFRGIVLNNVYVNSEINVLVRTGPDQVLALHVNEPVRLIMMPPEEYKAILVRKCWEYIVEE